jgi:hypothetical protein
MAKNDRIKLPIVFRFLSRWLWHLWARCAPAAVKPAVEHLSRTPKWEFTT